MSGKNTLRQMELNGDFGEKIDNESKFRDPAFASNKKRPIHRWVPWIAGFSHEFVADALDRYLKTSPATVLDPFMGVGTTLLESYLRGHQVVGFEINPYPHLATRVKLDVASIHVDTFAHWIRGFTEFYRHAMDEGRDPTSVPPSGFRTRSPFYSELVLKKVLTVFDFIHDISDRIYRDLFRLAFASTMVTYSNYSYEPSLGTRRGSGKADIEDYPVGEQIAEKLHEMLSDTHWFYANYGAVRLAPYTVHRASFFEANQYIHEASVDLIVTSPPYMNNYHYNRNTRPQLYWLDFVDSPQDMKPFEQANFGAYWQTVRDLDLVALDFQTKTKRLEDSILQLRGLNPEKGVYGGNGWANYASRYFNDAYRFAQQAYRTLKPGAKAFVVLGNSILQGVHFPTDQYLGEIAEMVGFKLNGIEIPRSERVGNSIVDSSVRASKTKRKQKLYESVVVLEK